MKLEHDPSPRFGSDDILEAIVSNTLLLRIQKTNLEDYICGATDPSRNHGYRLVNYVVLAHAREGAAARS